MQIIDEVPRIVIGGYSVVSNNGTPYMSGARFAYDGPVDEDDYEFFRSDFSSTGGPRGDQIWELQVHKSEALNNRIAAGGFHTSGTSVYYPTFAAIRLCPNPDEDPCGTGAPAPPSGGGRDSQGFGQSLLTARIGSDRLTTDQAGPGQGSLAQITALKDSPAPPLPDPTESDDVATPVVPIGILVHRSAMYDLFATSVL